MRVAHICVSPEWLRPHRQIEGVLASFVLHFVPPVAKTRYHRLVFFLLPKRVGSVSFARVPGLLWSRSLSQLLLSFSATVRGQSILYGLAKTCGDTSFPRRRASGCILWQQAEEVKPSDPNEATDVEPQCRKQLGVMEYN